VVTSVHWLYESRLEFIGNMSYGQVLWSAGKIAESLVFPFSVPAEIHFHVFFSSFFLWANCFCFKLSCLQAELAHQFSLVKIHFYSACPAVWFACPFVLVWIHLVPAQSKRADQFSIAAHIRLATRSAVHSVCCFLFLL
jgi:hypothetical protein